MLYVKLQGQEVKQVWDTPPPEGVGNNGWKAAVEVRPSINSSRQQYTDHTFDVTADPVQIVWGVRDVTMDERKEQLQGRYKSELQKVVQEELRKETDEFPETRYDAAAVDVARAAFEEQMTNLNGVTTHEQLDALFAA